MATPIPIREANEPAAVLVYDQWGWPRKRWPKARIIHDCVDTASLEFSEADAQIWSLSKVLGLPGGGLLRIERELVEFTSDPADREMGILPPDLRKAFVRWLPPEIVEASCLDIDAAFAREHQRRAENLAIVRKNLPQWMDAAVAPGLYPLEAPDLAAVQRTLAERGIDAPIYHFDFAGDPLKPDYRKCLAVPLHGEVSPDLLRLS